MSHSPLHFELPAHFNLQREVGCKRLATRASSVLRRVVPAELQRIGPAKVTTRYALLVAFSESALHSELPVDFNLQSAMTDASV